MAGRRVLVVDDHQDHRETLGEVLEASGFEVATAADGVAALARMAEGFTPDVVVVDLLMPGMDGATFLSEVRARGTPARTVVVTGVHSSALKKLIAADAILFKPYDTADLLAAVGAPRR